MKYKVELSAREVSENRGIFYERYEMYRQKGLDFFRSRENILSVAGLISEKILDVGSGRGITVIALAELGYRVTTIDNNEDMLRTTALNLAARGYLPLVEMHKMDAYAMEFPDSSFKTVFAVDALHHLERPGDFLSEAGRVLEEGGKMVLADLNEKGRGIIESVHAGEGRRHKGVFSGAEGIGSLLSRKGYKFRRHDDVCHWTITAEKPSCRPENPGSVFGYQSSAFRAQGHERI